MNTNTGKRAKQGLAISKTTKTYRVNQRIYSKAAANALAKGTTLSAVIRETVTAWAANK